MLIFLNWWCDSLFVNALHSVLQGSMLLTCSKDKSTRVFDPRSQEVVAEIAQVVTAKNH